MKKAGWRSFRRSSRHAPGKGLLHTKHHIWLTVPDGQIHPGWPDPPYWRSRAVQTVFCSLPDDRLGGRSALPHVRHPSHRQGFSHLHASSDPLGCQTASSWKRIPDTSMQSAESEDLQASIWHRFHCRLPAGTAPPDGRRTN